MPANYRSSLTIAVLVATAFTSDLLIATRIPAQSLDYFFAVAAAKYLVPLMAWLGLGMATRVATRISQDK